MMARVKSCLDPKGIMNPGKIFPTDTNFRRSLK
ncbi:FAD-linked oxidase C-terminal domain-containing protein [Martelella sp. AMO21009]